MDLQLCVWYNNWITNRPLADFFPQVSFSPNDRVSSFIVDGNWAVPSGLPPDICSRILSGLSSHPSPALLVPDRLTWCQASSGNLSTFDTRDNICSRRPPMFWSHFVWNKFLQPSTACFAWRLFHNKIPTFLWVKTIDIPLISNCPFCLQDEASLSHIFFAFPFAFMIWDWVLRLGGLHLPYPFTAGSLWGVLAFGYNNSDFLVYRLWSHYAFNYSLHLDLKK